MKTRHIIGVASIIILSIYFVSSGLAGSQRQVLTDNQLIEKAIPFKAIQDGLGQGDKIERDNSIFSKTTIISLVVAVIGIVAFRRNTYS